MTLIICDFCKNEFNSVSALNYHQKKTKYCLIIQGKNKKEKKEDFKCELCNKILASKQSLENHRDVCNIKKEKILENLTNLLQEKNNEIKDKDKLIIKINAQNENYKIQIEKHEEQIKDLQNKLERMLNKAIERPTTTTNNTVNNKFELNTFPSQKEIDRKIESQFNDKYILDGMKGVAQFVFDHIVKLEDGSMAYACFDTSRQIFKYKDEYGNEIKDPKAVKLRKMIKPGLLKQSQTLLDYFNDECDYLEKRKDNGQDIDCKEYNMMNTLREKAFEVGCELLNMEETNKFSTELANLSCV